MENKELAGEPEVPSHWRVLYRHRDHLGSHYWKYWRASDAGEIEQGSLYDAPHLFVERDSAEKVARRLSDRKDVVAVLLREERTAEAFRGPAEGGAWDGKA